MQLDFQVWNEILQLHFFLSFLAIKGCACILQSFRIKSINYYVNNLNFYIIIIYNLKILNG